MYNNPFHSCAYLYFGLIVTEDTYYIIENEWNPKMHMGRVHWALSFRCAVSKCSHRVHTVSWMIQQIYHTMAHLLQSIHFEVV